MGTCCCKNRYYPYNYVACETEPGCPDTVVCYDPYYLVCWGPGCE